MIIIFYHHAEIYFTPIHAVASVDRMCRVTVCAISIGALMTYKIIVTCVFITCTIVKLIQV